MPKPRVITLKDSEELIIRGNDFHVHLKEYHRHRVLDLSLSVEKAAHITPLALTRKLTLFPDARFRTVRLQAHGVRNDEIPETTARELVVLDDKDPETVLHRIDLDI